ncbi:hypothetical protein [Motilimonas sp. E26]|uniref:hypothetical protein n=1 Tax=Motilimonas sp. E26 TaxID=2865674 RepID=UPI001E5076DF|nr:hypothetical protein [Motilimonas sp. E26]MCE0558704.1 hypothetical protein [Motilimonas sp. E26]
MKFLVLIALLAGGAYFYMGNKEEFKINNYQDLLKKAEVEPVTMSEVKLGSNMLATFFCNDENFQKTGGSSVEKCLNTYNTFKSMCEDKIFVDLEQRVVSKDAVTKIAKRYTECVGIK